MSGEYSGSGWTSHLNPFPSRFSPVVQYAEHCHVAMSLLV